VSRRQDHGFTLVELLVVLSIIGVLALALTEALVSGWKTTSATATILSSSHDAQMVSSFWTSDVQGAAVLDSVGTDTRCLLTGDTLVARFTGTTTDASSVVTTFVAAYVQRVSGTETQLIRRSCAAIGSGALASTGDVVVVHGLGNPAVTPAAQTPALSCVPGCTAPRSVTLSVVEQSGYTFALTARRRSV
jgi:prepilin-type N-terminal cleavage/methylation domain-containing protein